MPVLNEYWTLVLENLKNMVSKSNYDAWFKKIEFSKTTNNGRKLILKVPSQFNKNYLEKKFQPVIREAVQRYFPQVVHLEFEIDSQLSLSEQVQEGIFDDIENVVLEPKNNLQLNSTVLPPKNLHNLNPKYTFETFVETSNNLLALNVARAIINKPGTLYNPVFLYSGVGMGKTHLLQAIGHQMLAKYPNFKIKYATCEMFFNHFISSIQNKKASDFHEYYRQIDVLLLDDIQFISAKNATQEAFFHAFNELHQNNKQIILTSDRPPKTLGMVEERLVSRFEWGLVIDISKAETEDKLAVLTMKSKQMNISLTSEQLLKIASQPNLNFRDLEGILNRIEARVKLIPNKPFEDFELNKLLGASALSSTVQINIGDIQTGPEALVKTVCEIFNVEKDEIMGNSRQQNIALARQIAMFCFKDILDFSFPAIGKFFKRDHTTALHAWKKIKKEIDENNPKITLKYDLIRKTCA